MFEKLEIPNLANKRKSRVVAEVITEALRERRYKPNQKLPAERVLAEQFGVSRGVVREALSALQIAGVIQVRTGEGSYVNDPSTFEDNAAEAITILEQNESPLELWEARREIEVTIVRLAATLASADHIAAAKDRLDAMRRCVAANDRKRYLKINAEFHEALMKPVENSILQRLANQLIVATNQMLTREPVQQYLESNLPGSLKKHVDIFHAYERRDADAIRTSIARHFDALEEFYLQGAEQDEHA